MRQPSTELDRRFSAPGAQPTGWAETVGVLRDAELFWLTTIRVGGRPHVTPLVGVWVDDALHFCTGSGEQKAVNLRANPGVILTTGCNRWDQGLDIVVEGDAVRVTDHQALEHLAEAWAGKWDGRWRYLVADGGFRHHGDDDVPPEAIHVFAVEPSTVFAFGKTSFSQTRSRF